MRTFLKRIGLRGGVLAACASGLMLAQSPEGGQRDGFRIYNVMLSGGYSSGVDESLLQGPSARDMGTFGSVSTEVGYSRTRPDSEFSITYTPSYIRIQGSKARSFSESLAFAANRRLGSHWMAVFSGWANDTTMDQLILTAVPTNTSTTSGQTTPGDATVNPSESTPSAGGVYGSRLLMANTNAGVAYSPNTRLSVRFTLGLSRQQSISDNGANSGGSVLIPQTTTGQGGVGLTYALSPRTYVGFNSESMRVYSRLQDYYVTHNEALIGKKLTPHWSGQVQGGIGILTPIGATSADFTATRSSSFGGSLTYQARTLAFSGTYRKLAGDTYGFGARSSDSASAGWTWRPQRNWAVYLLGDWERLERDTNMQSWQGYTGISRQVSRHTWLMLSYAYLESMWSSSTGSNLKGWSARMSLVWTPGAQMDVAPR